VNENLHSNTYWDSFACEIQCEDYYESEQCREREVNESHTERMTIITPNVKHGEANQRNLQEEILSRS